MLLHILLNVWGSPPPPAGAILSKWWRSQWIAHSLWTWILGSFFPILNNSIVQHKEIKYYRRKVSELWSKNGWSQVAQLITTSIDIYLNQNFCVSNPGKFFNYPYLIPFSPLSQIDFYLVNIITAFSIGLFIRRMVCQYACCAVL